MTDGDNIAAKSPIALILAMLARVFAPFAALLRRIPETDRRTHDILNQWFAIREAQLRAGDKRAAFRVIMLVRFARRLAHRQRTQQGRGYKRRRRSSWIVCMERRMAHPRLRAVSACARASIPFAPVNLAPP